MKAGDSYFLHFNFVAGKTKEERLGSTSTSTTHYSGNAHVRTGIAGTLGSANWAPTRRT